MGAGEPLRVYPESFLVSLDLRFRFSIDKVSVLCYAAQDEQTKTEARTMATDIMTTWEVEAVGKRVILRLENWPSDFRFSLPADDAKEIGEQLVRSAQVAKEHI